MANNHSFIYPSGVILQDGTKDLARRIAGFFRMKRLKKIMGGIFGSTTISTSDNRINSMRVQQSAYGLYQPLVCGKTGWLQNMFWYGDFSSTAHTTTTKSGGKGGKTKTSNTTYTYSASLMLGLCETKIRDIGNIWRDKGADCLKLKAVCSSSQLINSV